MLVSLFPSPKHVQEKLVPVNAPILTNEPARHEFTKIRANHVLEVASKFVSTAVARKHIDDSWELTAPSLKDGYTKRSWARGNIPVVPYPVGGARWDVSSSVTNEVDLQVALFPKPKHKVKPTVFDLTLHRYGSGKHTRWLVSSFMPVPNLGGGGGGAAATGPVAENMAAHTSGIWLLVPLGGFLGLLLLVPATLGLKSLRARRAYRAHTLER